MPKYAVISATWEVTIPILDDGTGPSELTCAYAEVEAKNPRAAKVLAVQQWRKTTGGQGHDYIQGCASDRRSPFAGLRVENLEALGLEVKP